MSVVFVLLPISAVLAAAAVWAFVWAVRHGQLDDLDTPSVRMLHDTSDTSPKAPGRATPTTAR